MKRLLYLFTVAATIATAAPQLQLADQFRLVTVSDPQLAPDGKSIVCVVSRQNVNDNRHEAQLVLVDVASAAQRVLTSPDKRRAGSPRWSSDGTQLAFLANPTPAEARRQLFVLPMNGGEARRVTNAPLGVQQFTWSPDGQSLAFVTSDEAAKKPDDQKNNLAFEIGNDAYLSTSAALPSHVWIVSADGGKTRRLTSGTWSVPIATPPGPPPSPLAWSPDGKSIAITHRSSPHTGDRDEGWIELIDVNTGATRRLTSHTHSETTPVFSPDGTQVSYSFTRSGERGDFQDIWLTSPGGGEGRNLTRALDCNIVRGVWMADGKSLIVGGNEGTGVTLWQQPAAGGTARRLDLGDINPFTGSWLDVTTAANGSIAFTGLTPTHPRELYYLSTPDAKPRRLTNFNQAIAELELGRSERITWEFEGFKEDGVLVYPPGFEAGKKYPLVVYIHGGPRSASTLSFGIIPQALAAQGWVVFQPNYRGSDNLGQAYARAVIRDSGAGPGRDVMAGLEAVKRRGFVDENRMVVGGWSYGGYMTSWLIGHHQVFRAAVSGAAVNNLLDAYNLSDNNVSRRHVMGGSPYTSPENLQRFIEQSPITYAHRVKTPTLILCNTGDVRVPITQSYQFYHALRDNGVPVRFFAYPVGGHSPEDPVHMADITARYVDWFKQHLEERVLTSSQ